MPKLPVSANLTFFYYDDLPKAVAFYEQVMGLSLIVDQGFCKIYEITPQSYIGLVDAEHGTHKPSPAKPVILSFVTPEVDGWYAHLQKCGVPMLHPLGTSAPKGRAGSIPVPGIKTVLRFLFTRPFSQAFLLLLS